ncbi:MAG: oxidoreductase alpha (molybdopterin) subunit [Frankiales bacterium]|nr:oxidoreductase alpha (molybdopterin) subunit [Frankiales bacterium]
MASKAPRGDRDDAGMRVSPPKDHAAGLPAVVVSMRDGLQQMGIRRTALTLLKVNQADGFDCPGCAWPEHKKRKHAEFCENGAKAVAEEATLRRVDRAFFAAHSVHDLDSKSEHWLGQQGRLTEPMYKPAGSDHYQPISWDDALDLVAAELKALPSPDAAAFYTSGRTSNEAAFVYQLVARLFGTNNLPDCSNMCHESSGVALGETLGIGKGTVSLDDVENADLILVVGQNPGTNHPRMLTTLENAKGNGATIVAVNPLPEAGLRRFKNPQTIRGVVGHGTALEDLFLQIRLNGDLALFQALGLLLLEAEDAAPGTVLDQPFIAEHTSGFEAHSAHLRQLSWDDVLASTGLTREEVEQLRDLVLASRNVIVCWAMGLTQHKNAVETIREVVNVLLLRGSIGRPGAGVCPVRGHSNVQGDRTMGIWEKPPAAFLDALGTEFGFVPPRKNGHDVVDTIRAMRDGQVQVFMACGGNFAAATPDTNATHDALRRCRLTVQMSTKLNRSHVVTGAAALILPVLGRTERDRTSAGDQVVSVEDSMSSVHTSRGTLPPASEHLRSEVSVLCGLGHRLAPGGADWTAMATDYAVVRGHVSRVIPGFEDFEERLTDGFVLPLPPREREWHTATGKAQFTVNTLEVMRLPPGRLILQTIRSHDQYNTTMYGRDDRYRGIKDGRRVLFVSPADLASRGLEDGQHVDIVSEWPDGVERRAARFRLVSYPTAVDCCAAYFPETNVLVPLDSTADRSGTPTSKSVIVRLEPAA